MNFEFDDRDEEFIKVMSKIEKDKQIQKMEEANKQTINRTSLAPTESK